MGGGTPHRKSVYIFSEQGTNRGWGHRTYFLNRANKGGGTPNIKTVSQYKLQVRLMAGWVGGWVAEWLGGGVAGPVIIVIIINAF